MESLTGKYIMDPRLAECLFYERIHNGCEHAVIETESCTCISAHSLSHYQICLACTPDQMSNKVFKHHYQ